MREQIKKVGKFLNELFGNDRTLAFLTGSSVLGLSLSISHKPLHQDILWIVGSIFFFMLYRRRDKKLNEKVDKMIQDVRENRK